jgi:hypothetical protein
VTDAERIKGNAVKSAAARARAASLQPLIEEIRAAGATTLRAIAEGLKRRGIPAPVVAIGRPCKWRGCSRRRESRKGLPPPRQAGIMFEPRGVGRQFRPWPLLESATRLITTILLSHLSGKVGHLSPHYLITVIPTRHAQGRSRATERTRSRGKAPRARRCPGMSGAATCW